MSWKKLIGLGPQLRRRTDTSRALDVFIGATVGVVSGTYMFGEPLKEHFEEKEEESRKSFERELKRVEAERK